MRLVCLFPAAILVVAISATFAQTAETLTEFANCEYRVGANFPGEPATRDFSYTLSNGVSAPAREFAVENEMGRFLLTAVDYTSSNADMNEVIELVSDGFRERGELFFETDEELEDGIPGRQFSLSEPGGTRVLASVYVNPPRLYIFEGIAPAGALPSAQLVQFVQSIMVLDETGREVDPSPGANRYQAANC